MKTYSGKMIGDNDFVKVGDDEDGRLYSLPPRLDVRKHSTTGFSWGYTGSGPAQLALAILLDHVGPGYEGKAEHWYQEFKIAFVAKWDQNEPWKITSTVIAAWLSDIERKSPSPESCRWKGVLTVPEDAWEESGHEDDPKARLYAQIDISGCPMHLEAYAVEYDGRTDENWGEQRFADGCTFEDCEHGFYSFVEGAARSIKIMGREYVLIATPHQE